MVLLGLQDKAVGQAGVSVLGQVMEKITGGNLLLTLLIACTFTLSLIYLSRLAVGHLASLPTGVVRTPAASEQGTQ